MTLAIATQPVPLKPDPAGIVRVSGTRVTLDTIVAAFQNGAAAEEIAQQYPAVCLADIYDVIGYYLRNKAAVEDYLRQQQTYADVTRKEWSTHSDMRDLRERLLARRSSGNQQVIYFPV